MLDAPAASCAKVESTRVVTTDTPVHPAFPHAMVLTVSFALSSVIGLCCHRRLRTRSTSLTPASRRQDHTTSPSASQRPRQSAARVHRIPPRVRDDRDTPLQWDETARDIELIWVWPKARFRKFRKNHAHRPTLGVDQPAASPWRQRDAAKLQPEPTASAIMDQVSPPAKISFLMTA